MRTEKITPAAMQRRFFAAAGPNIGILRNLLERMPNVATYIKDDKGRFMAINRCNRENCGIVDEGEVIGRRTCDVFKGPFTEHIMERDRRVRETGRPIVNQLETRTVHNPASSVLISIYPVRSRRGKIIGTVAAYYSQSLNTNKLPNAEKIGNAVEYLHNHYAENIHASDLARRFGLSVPTFYRVFAQTMKTSPVKYLESLRLARARVLLETTNLKVTDIALQCGFFDHSHFGRVFRSTFGITPGRHRLRHRAVSA